MQAAFPLRRSSIQPILVVLAIAAALVISAVGGYWLKSVSSQAATSVTIARQSSATGSSQGLFGSANPLATGGGRASDAVPAAQPARASHRGPVLY
jgi:hypothetical protein